MTTVLAADTSTSINTVAVCRDGALLAETVVQCGRLHAERLIDTVDWVLGEAGMVLSGIDLLAVTVGPGSFTGLRIGAATWKGLAFSADRPLIGVPTLDAMVVPGPYADMLVCPLLDARMQEIYGAVYRFSAGERERLTPDRVCPVEALLEGAPCGPMLFLGDGASVYRDRIVAVRPDARFAPGCHAVPRASCVADEALRLHAAGACSDPAALSPVYLRQSQAETNRALRNAGAVVP